MALGDPDDPLTYFSHDAHAEGEAIIETEDTVYKAHVAHDFARTLHAQKRCAELDIVFKVATAAMVLALLVGLFQQGTGWHTIARVLYLGCMALVAVVAVMQAVIKSQTAYEA
jgi:hypothetical protein